MQEGMIRQTLVVHIASDTKHFHLTIGSNVVHSEVTEIHTFCWTQMLFELLQQTGFVMSVFHGTMWYKKSILNHLKISDVLACNVRLYKIIT